MNLSGPKSARAFTLVEMLMTLASSSIVMAAVLVGGVALQRSFAAVEGYSIAEGDQLRVEDYIAMDCRRALTASVDTSGTSPVLNLTIPNYYDANNNTPTWSNAHAVAPTFTSTGGIQYGAGLTTVAYSASGTSFIRTVNGIQTVIASNVASFAVSTQDLTSSVSCSITFSPAFTSLPGPGPIAGTTVYCNTFLRNAVARQ